MDGAFAGAPSHLRGGTGIPVRETDMNTRRSANLRSAMLLVALALVFFVAVMVRYRLFGQ